MMPAMSNFSDLPADPAERAEAYRLIAEALAWLREHAKEQPSLAELAARTGLSEFHFQRLFTRWAGVSPKRFLQHLARERALAALLAGNDLLSASHEAGLSGPGRLHDLLVRCEAATPGEVRSGGAGLTIAWGTAPTPFGRAFLAQSARGLMQMSFLADDVAAATSALHAGVADATERAAIVSGEGASIPDAVSGTVACDEAVTALQLDWPQARLVRDDAGAHQLATRIFARYRAPEPLTLFLRGTPFQLKVWEALLRIPDGRLVTYGALASGIGQPAASRAVGSAVGANPVALLIPCHRVIRASGVLGGYRWGVPRKQLLVALELAAAPGGVPQSE
ncbi:MAG: 6-O-methylguanine methyltransferase [Moraxellaceae bacterium]|jgi:AraC family transcriptional regulator of adaptative response/methylated-DNA-[protein]-cysteine methyltransferase|nr:6-O-methylguanine methyltransferase [Moraxellaceae bacterium]